jgi:hypothetical protein
MSVSAGVSGAKNCSAAPKRIDAATFSLIDDFVRMYP